MEQIDAALQRCRAASIFCVFLWVKSGSFNALLLRNDKDRSKHRDCYDNPEKRARALALGKSPKPSNTERSAEEWQTGRGTYPCRYT